MNCAVCGNPLLFDRVAFNCSCGAFVHAYCWNEHVLQAHRPLFEIGAVNLDGEFVLRENKVEVAVSEIIAIEEEASEVEATGEEASESTPAESADSEERAAEGPASEEAEVEEKTAEEQASGEDDSERQAES